MRLRGLWQVVGSWAFICVYGLAASAVTVATLGQFSRHLSPWLLRVFGRTMLWLGGVTYEVQGAEHLLTDSMKVVTFNHSSLIDAFLVTAVMPTGSVAAIKREVLAYPVAGLAVYLLGFLIIDRGSKGRSRKLMDRAAKRMANERLAVFIAPEGTRRKCADLLPFKRGAMHLAQESGAPIVPMLIDGAYELHGPGKLVSTPGHVVIRFLAPRPTAGLSAEAVAAESDALRDVYTRELSRLRSERIAAGTWPATLAPLAS